MHNLYLRLRFPIGDHKKLRSNWISSYHKTKSLLNWSKRFFYAFVFAWAYINTIICATTICSMPTTVSFISFLESDFSLVKFVLQIFNLITVCEYEWAWWKARLITVLLNVTCLFMMTLIQHFISVSLKNLILYLNI